MATLAPILIESQFLIIYRTPGFNGNFTLVDAPLFSSLLAIISLRFLDLIGRYRFLQLTILALSCLPVATPSTLTLGDIGGLVVESFDLVVLVEQAHHAILN